MRLSLEVVLVQALFFVTKVENSLRRVTIGQRSFMEIEAANVDYKRRVRLIYKLMEHERRVQGSSSGSRRSGVM